MNPRTERERIRDIIRAIDAVAEHRNRAQDLELPADDALILDAVVRQLTIIGAAASQLSNNVTARHDQIAWRGVTGMRLMLDHEYHRVDPDSVWRTGDDDLPCELRSSRSSNGLPECSGDPSPPRAPRPELIEANRGHHQGVQTSHRSAGSPARRPRRR